MDNIVLWSVPALFRGDFITFIGAFVIYFILNAVSFWIVGTIAMVVGISL
ncbi:UNVERIFIED_ORG: hypothetical protein [Escherichia phage CMSTMSU]